jgi:hypothetical protein
MVPGERAGFDPHKVLEVTATSAQVIIPPHKPAVALPPVVALVP